MNILVVDDDPSVRFTLEITLGELGHQAVLEKDGVEALRFFQRGHVPLIISDMMMPNMDGLELCRRIRKANRAQYTYIILLTAVDARAGYLDGMQAGADDFMSKPFDKEVLRARLVVAQRILSLQSQVKQLAGLLPICVICKKVRDDRNYWHRVESYITHHTDTTFTHTSCPDCFQHMLREVQAVKSTQ